MQPPVFRKGEKLKADKLNAFTQWVLSVLPTFAASSGLIQSGNTVRAATPRGGRYALVNAGGITAGSGDTLGIGSIRLLDRDTTSNNGRTLIDSGVDDTCFNRGGGIDAGHYVLVDWVDNAWSVIVDVC